MVIELVHIRFVQITFVLSVRSGYHDEVSPTWFSRSTELAKSHQSGYPPSLRFQRMQGLSLAAQGNVAIQLGVHTVLCVYIHIQAQAHGKMQIKLEAGSESMFEFSRRSPAK